MDASRSLSSGAHSRDPLARSDGSMTSRTATLVGLTAILMWSLLSVMTVATGKIPAFQLAAMTFAIGAAVAFASFLCRPSAFGALRQPPLAWIVGVGGLFGYHALYFLALRFAPPAEAGLLNYLWPLLIVLFSSLLPGERLAPHHIIGALLGLAGTVLLFAGNSGGGFAPGQIPGLAAAFVAAFVWAAYSVMSRKLKAVPTDAVAGFCLATALLAALVHGMVETTVLAGNDAAMARDRRARRRPGGCGVLCLGYRHEARRYPRAGCCVLRDAAALDGVSDSGRLRQAERRHRHRRGADRRRRPDRGQGYDLEVVRRFLCNSGLALRASRQDFPYNGGSHPFGASLKLRKIKSRRDRASHQGPVAGTFGGLPRALAARSLAVVRLQIRSAPSLTRRWPSSSAIRRVSASAGVIVPGLGRVDAVPVRTLAARQQEIDRGRK